MLDDKTNTMFTAIRKIWGERIDARNDCADEPNELGGLALVVDVWPSVAI